MKHPTLASLAVVLLSLSLAKASPAFNAVQPDTAASFEMRADSVMTPQDITNAARDLLIREELAAAIAHAEKERSRRRNNHRPSASPAFLPTAAALPSATSHSLHSHRPSHTPSGTYTPSPSKSYNGPSASASASAHARAKAKREMEEAKKVILESPWEGLDHSLLCPGGETACPIFPRLGSWECLDTQTELESCGGCTSKGQGEDCTTIKGAQGVTCDLGRCLVFTCQAGYKLDAGRCHKTKSVEKA